MKKTFVIIMIGVILALTGCATSGAAKLEPGKITCAEKEEILKYDNNPTLIDVRTEEEYNEGHLPKAINIPYEIITEVVSKNSNIKKDTPLIVYCRSGARSAKAAASLKSAGYTAVYDLGAKSNCE